MPTLLLWVDKEKRGGKNCAYDAAGKGDFRLDTVEKGRGDVTRPQLDNDGKQRGVEPFLLDVRKKEKTALDEYHA